MFCLLVAFANVANATCSGGTPNGTVQTGERCDDNNLVNGDGCDSNCTATACGNSITTAGEQCDDGNAVEGDGCDTNCTTTACGNYVIGGNAKACDGDSSPCANNADCALLGAGFCVFAGAEECDDGNVHDGDGCSATCQFELATCGDGVLQETEECDDGGLVNDDGCAADCTIESDGDLDVAYKELSVVVKTISREINVGDMEALSSSLYKFGAAAYVKMNAAGTEDELVDGEKSVLTYQSKYSKLFPKLQKILTGVLTGRILLSDAVLKQMSDVELQQFADAITPTAQSIYGTSHPDLCPPFDCSMAALPAGNSDICALPAEPEATMETDEAPRLRHARADKPIEPAVEAEAQSCGESGVSSLLNLLNPGNFFVGDAEAALGAICVAACSAGPAPCLACISAAAPTLKFCWNTFNSLWNNCCNKLCSNPGCKCKWNKIGCCPCKATAIAWVVACIG